jgi:hypothetical protein
MAAALVACAAPAPAPTPAPVEPPCPEKAWLQLQDELTELDQQAAVEALVAIGRPADAEGLYRYGLLNQQLESYGAWVQARDSFKTLLEEPGLSKEQRTLVRQLLQYNQRRINWSTRIGELQQEEEALRSSLAESEAERALLEQKIEALTDIETAISTRKAE